MTDAFSDQDYASWGRRFAAWILDSFIFVVAFSIALLGFAAARGGSIHLEDGEFLLPIAGFSLLWDVGWISGASGKPGHRLLGFRIRLRDGARVPVVRAVARWAVRGTNYVFFGLEAVGSAITIAATPRNQSVHDLVASTVAVRRDAVARLENPLGHAPVAMPAPNAPPAPSSPSSSPGPFSTDEDPTQAGGPFL